MSDAYIPVHVVASYKFFGDADPTEWMNVSMQDAQESNMILTFRLLDVTMGSWGVQHVSFTVDMLMPKVTGSKKQTRRFARNHLEMVLGDRDVAVYFIGEPN